MIAGEKRITSGSSVAGLALFLLIAIIWSSVPFLTPFTLAGENFVVSDQSYALFTADQLLSGKLLFRDVFYQYGPLAAYLHAGWSSIFGNTALSYCHLAQFLTCISVVQIFWLLRERCSIPHCLIGGILVVFPYFLIPGSGIGGLGASVYVGLERIFFLGIALAWKRPDERSLRSAVLVGVLLGGLQWTKFGGAFVAGIALVLLDLIILRSALWRRDCLVGWMKRNLATLSGFVAVESVLVALAFALLPQILAAEVIWPSWMLDSYASYRYRSISFLHWFNANYFIGVQLPIVAAFVVNSWWLVRLFHRKGSDAAGRPMASWTTAGPMFFLALFFALSLGGYLPHFWVALPYAWMFLLPAVVALSQSPVRLQIVFALLCVPAFGLSLKAVAFPSRPSSITVYRNGRENLWLSPGSASRFRELQRVLQDLREERWRNRSSEPAILGFTFGSGYHHLFQYPAATRHAWFVPGFVRPREEAGLLKSLEETLAVVVYFPQPQARPPSPDPRSWEPFSLPVMSENTCLAFAAQLQPPLQIDAQCWVFPVAAAATH